MKIIGATYYKCVLCRYIIEFNVIRDDRGYCILFREGEASPGRFCSKVSRTTSELQDAVIRSQAICDTLKLSRG